MVLPSRGENRAFNQSPSRNSVLCLPPCLKSEKFSLSLCWPLFTTSLLAVLFGVFFWVSMFVLSWDFWFLRTAQSFSSRSSYSVTWLSPLLICLEFRYYWPSLASKLGRFSTSICVGKRLAWIRPLIRQWLAPNNYKGYPYRQPYATLTLTLSAISSFRVLNTSVHSSGGENRFCHQI